MTSVNSQITYYNHTVSVCGVCRLQIDTKSYKGKEFQTHLRSQRWGAKAMSYLLEEITKPQPHQASKKKLLQ